ncbi:MAG: acyl-CoA thioesterase-1 [Oleiphilaceae bacterium]|jgi:acyl-CoA thioesterase-1
MLFAWPSLNYSETRENQRQAITTEKTVLVIGDSISAAFGLDQLKGWVQIIATKFEGQLNFVNASISGDTTAGGRNRILKALAEHQPSLVVIELGGNDGLRGTPIPLIKANLASMIKDAQAANSKVLLLGMKIPPNYGERYTQLFETMYRELAKEYKTLFVPFFLEGVAGMPEMMQSDGLHPTEKAQPIMADLVVVKLTEWLVSF